MLITTKLYLQLLLTNVSDRDRNVKVSEVWL